MEYLQRYLQKIKGELDFNYHYKWEKLHIVNLSFADDLLLFSRGDNKSVELVMNVFTDFSKSTCLTFNSAKCKIYYGSVADRIKEEIHAITSFNEGRFPFRYLGVSLTSKKLSYNNV